VQSRNELIELYISAPNGCSDVKTLFNSFKNIDLTHFRIIILEYEPNCRNFSNSSLNKIDIEHRLFTEFSEFTMRKESFEKSKADWLIYLEDHAIPDISFFNELKLLLSQKMKPNALTFYCINGTPESIGSRAIYNWTWGESEVSVYPENPAPVCSAFIVNRKRATLEIEKRGGKLQKGELEMQIIPELIRQNPNMTQPRITVIHFENINLITAVKAAWCNSRVTGHLEESLLQKKGWLSHMFARYFKRNVRIRRIYSLGLMESFSLEIMALVSFMGVLVGNLFGAGGAEKGLADAHPEAVM
jgi:hypothetical protein